MGICLKEYYNASILELSTKQLSLKNLHNLTTLSNRLLKNETYSGTLFLFIFKYGIISHWEERNYV